MQLSEFKTYVKQDFKRVDKDTEIVQAWNDMVMWVALQMPHGGYKFQSYVQTIAGTEDYAIPCNLIHFIHPAKLIIGSGSSDGGYPLDFIPKKEYDIIEANPNRSAPARGRPSRYTIFSRSMLLTPVPDVSTYIVEINWSKRPVAMTEDEQHSELHAEWDEVLKQGVLERLYAAIGLFEESAHWGSKYHILGAGGDMPVGICAHLLNIEKDREETSVNTMRFNDL